MVLSSPNSKDKTEIQLDEAKAEKQSFISTPSEHTVESNKKMLFAILALLITLNSIILTIQIALFIL
jgi:hypothetical protein